MNGAATGALDHAWMQCSIHLPVCLPQRNQNGNPAVIRSGIHTTFLVYTTLRHLLTVTGRDRRWPVAVGCIDIGIV